MRFLPNLLSFSRLFFLPLLLWMLFREGLFGNQVVRVAVMVLVYVFACLTDYWDGYFSRRLGHVSRFGEFLDPLADKIMIIGMYLGFVFLESVPLPVSLIAAIIVREVLITALRVFALSRNTVMKTEKHGKIKTTMQFVSQGMVWAVLLFYAIVSETRDFQSTVLPGHGTLAAAKAWVATQAWYPAWLRELVHQLPRLTVAVACFFALFSGYQYLKGNWRSLFQRPV
ncbi:MAG: CDP-diacylglycerol--glycerol-3-phosphate 3-phosphatidyltransferase [Spirochaetes bacterium]|nr:CDP-diacylglycerol--glycerol-3-phosphate 3-phosphatidyltransferase [Spirochaetota bacterium]